MEKNLIAIAFWLVSTTLLAQTAIVPQGSGSQNDPYQIETWENIYWLSENADAWDKHFEQTADIEFPEDIVNWDNSKGLNSIGAGYNDDAGEAYPFTGHYDGQNFSISNVYINRGEEYAEGMGLFGAIENASLKNIKLNNVHIIGYTQVGGLVGSSWLGEIENTQVSGYVKGRENVGGLAGQSFNGTITKSFTNTQVEGADSWWAKFIGGFIGSNSSIITECFSSGTVEGRLGVGGFAGENIRVQEEEVKIENCFSLTSVTVYQEDAEWYGGFVGDIQSGKINKCYSVGNVSYLNGTAPNNVGFVGNITSTGSNFEMNGNYWDTETSRQTSTQGSTDNGSSLPQGKTTAEMKNINTFTGWDFTNIWQIDAEINSGYPYLKFAEVSMPVGSGSEENPFVIATLGNLRWFAEQVNVFEGKYFVQTQNIDATATQNWNEGEGWKPKAYFKGTYNGNGFTIDGLFMNADRSAGLFDYIENATIKNLGLTNVDLTGSMYSAGLVGTTDASNIENCYVTGSVKGSDEVGGLIGRNGMNTAIAKAYFNGIITGEDFVGGLIGRNDGNYNTSVSCCYSAGTVKGDRFVGGFVGANYKQTTIEDCYSRSNVVVNVNAEYFGGFAGRNENAAINKCYSTGIVDYENEVTVYSKGFVGSCVDGNDYYMRYNYWDTESSAQVSNLADENAATGLTTSQMKTRESFIGWDFENTWVIDAGINDGYPSFVENVNITNAVLQLFDDELINVYPNPFNSYIVIEQLPDAKNISLYNILGNKIMDVPTSDIENITIQTSNLENGTYLLVIQYQNKPSIAARLIKK
ncbi:MAG: GLUG motif-containing protein [Methanolobus sp.]|nr:GLUG motif-containing protein [Methanolobus sp.]